MIDISNRRECFFDDYLIDVEKTTAEFRLHEPIRKEVVMTLTEPWGGSASTYFNMFYDIDENGNEYDSYETFGNSLDRKIRFIDENSVKKLSGKAVVLKIRVKDGDAYSIKFN